MRAYCWCQICAIRVLLLLLLPCEIVEHGVGALSSNLDGKERRTAGVFGGTFDKQDLLFPNEPYADLSEFQQFCMRERPLFVLPDAVPLHRIQGWKRDALSLYHAGFGSEAGVASPPIASSATAAIRKHVHQIWLQTPGTPPLQSVVGDLDGRRDLTRYVETLRCRTSEHSGGEVVLPGHLIELSYVLYDEIGAYYAMHVDAFQQRGTKHRLVSLVLYLGGLDDEKWETERHGGALRIYTAGGIIGPTEEFVAEDDVYVDISPYPGTLVIFDSVTVQHEVLPVHRKRICVVGWFGTE
jgi:2OG-Fe(II) oxygenase superfamily